MNPQHDHYLFELNRHHIHQPDVPQHTLPRCPQKWTLWREKLGNGLHFIRRLRRIRIQIVFEEAVEPHPDGC